MPVPIAAAAAIPFIQTPAGQALISGGLSFLGNTIGGIFGMSAQDKANRLAIELQDRQNAFNLKMWNLQNEYNDPKNQMKRLLNAGLNPWMSGIQPGQAGTLTSAPAPQIMPVDAMGKAVQQFGQDAANIVANLPNAMKTNAEAQQQLIDNQTRSIRNYMDIRKLEKDGDLTDAQAKKLKQDTLFDLTTFNTRASMLRQQDRFIQNQVVESQLRQINQDLLNQNQLFQNLEINPLRKKELITNINNVTVRQQMDWRRLALDTQLTMAQVNQMVANTRKLVAEAIGQENNNKLFNRTLGFTLTQMKMATQQAKYNAMTAREKALIAHNERLFDRAMREQALRQGNVEYYKGLAETVNTTFNAIGKAQDILVKPIEVVSDVISDIVPW